MKILAIALAFLIPFAFAATCEPQAVEPLVTLECTDATGTSLTANAKVNKLEAGSLVRRGFVFMEGTAGTPSFNATPLVNASFEEGDPPDGWSVFQVSRARVSTPVKSGDYSVEIASQADKAGNLYQRNPIPASEAEGRTVTFGAWVHSTAADRVSVAIRDVVGGQHAMTTSAHHPGDGSWHWLTATRTLRSNLDYWTVEIRVDAGNVIVVHADAAALAVNAVFQDGGFGTGSFSREIRGLRPDTSYRVRAFVVDVEGVRYGNVVTCQTAS